MTEAQQHPDDCPRCGTRVESEGSFGLGARREGDPLPEATQQARQCPSCDAQLRRAVGMAWSVVAEPWLVTVRATPHDAVVSERGSLIGMLVRGSSLEPDESGLGPGRYTFEVQATDADEARAAVEAAAARDNVTIHEVEDARPGRG